jgi:Phosphotransferase enzyme family
MLLTETNIIHYLLGNGLTDKGTFVRGDYSCHSSKGRHCHFIINKKIAQPKLFIKQAQLNNAEKTNSLLREGFFYQLIPADDIFNLLRPHLPGILLWDEKDVVIVFEYYGDCINLYDWLLNSNENNSPDNVTDELAASLYSLHSIQSGDLKDAAGFFIEIKPWILRLPESKKTGDFAARSEAEQQGLNLIFSIPGFEELIEKTAQLWETSGIIHGDARLNNFLLNKEEDGVLVKWIDWETVSAGDPLWDVATVFQSALTAWVVGGDPLFNTVNGKKSIDAARMQEFFSSLWKKYVAHNNWDDTTARNKLEKCTRFCGLRLLHSCFETTPGVESLQPYSARLLQLAHNILSNPMTAYQQLLGIKIKT